MKLEPFEVSIAEHKLEDLHDRLARARISAAIPGAAWDYGTEREYLEELVRYWRDDYDWRRAEARLNTYSQFTTTIDGARVHFLHRRSPASAALPILLVHGWPGSILEFLDVIDPLADPRQHGGDAADAFDVVCVSIPGFGFSGPTSERGWNFPRMADAFAALMAELGYDRYVTQGGDAGALITTQLALRDRAHVAGIHLNFLFVPVPADLDHERLSDDEQAALAATARFMAEESGYLQIQCTRPQTIGYALDDSPVGLAAWIVEKFRAWSDCDGDVERRFTKDQLLDNIMLYWLTGTAHSAARMYFESSHTPRVFTSGEHVDVPTAIAAFPRDHMPVPRRWAEPHYNITRWTDMPRGGHFAAMEEGELLVDDVRAAFRPLR